MDFDATIVGAGPFGLSGAAYLKDKGIGVGTFGNPMSFWQNHMPAGMYLRSNWVASNISDPCNKFTIDHFQADTGLQFTQPIPLQHFVAYGKWYQQKSVPDLSLCQVSNVEKHENGFKVTLSDGQVVKSKRVVIATGIAPFPWMPKELEGLPKSHVTHSSDHSDLSRFRSQQVLVVGAGQSALDAARLLHSFDAKVEIVARQGQIRWVGQNAWLHRLGFISWCLYSNFDVGPAAISRLVGLPNLFRRFAALVAGSRQLSSGPAGGHRLATSVSGAGSRHTQLRCHFLRDSVRQSPFETDERHRSPGGSCDRGHRLSG